MYILKTTDKATIQLDENQRNLIAEALNKGVKHILVNDNLIMTHAITGIYKDDVHDKQEGYLHDGTKVIKKFGTWFDANNSEVKIDPTYYPEVARDRVNSEKPKKALPSQKNYDNSTDTHQSMSGL